MPKKLIIEARINEYAMRADNPNVPWTPQEIADCAVRCGEEGASIVHFHARTSDGAPAHSADLYAEIITRIRARSDVLLHPTLGWFSNDADPRARIDCITTLARDPATRPDFAPIDTGSVNLDLYDRELRRFEEAPRVYLNRTDTLELYARELRAARVKPILVVWSVGFLRRALAMIEMGLIDGPAYFLLNMTDGPYITGLPGNAEGLDTFLRFLPDDLACEWTANIVGGDLLALAPHAIARGGHVTPGIGDFAYTGIGAPPNEELVRRTAAIARDHGRAVATPDDARTMLDLPSRHEAFATGAPI